jgi:hypothetical protein
MQEMMKNMMDNWMKNFDGLKGFDFPKQMDFMKGFDSPKQMDFMKGLNMSKIGRQVLDFQKLMFDNTYDMVVKIHEQEDKVMDNFMKGQTMIPAESLKMLTGWRDIAHKGQNEFKKAIDESFKQAEALLANLDQSGAPKKQAAKGQKSGK